MWKGFCALFKKDCRMLVSGKFFLMAIGFLALYTAYVNLGYIRFMQMPPYNVYLYDPAGTQTEAVYPGDKNGLPFDVVVERLHFGEPEHEQPEQGQKPAARNFRITDDHLGEGGPKAKFRANMDAINLLHELEFDGRDATPEEQEVLSRYVGWGGLADAFDEKKDSWASEFKELYAALSPEEYAAARASTLNAHYTSPTVIRAIYDAVEQMGFQKGNILEPSMGVGNFFGLLPESMQGSRLYGVELDSITGRIAQKLYPEADIKVAGFQTTDRRDFFDLCVGNVPFGDYKVNDKPYNKRDFWHSPKSISIWVTLMPTAQGLSYQKKFKPLLMAGWGCSRIE